MQSNIQQIPQQFLYEVYPPIIEIFTLYQGKHAPWQKMPRQHVLTGSHVGQNMPPSAKKRLKLR